MHSYEEEPARDALKEYNDQSIRRVLEQSGIIRGGRHRGLFAHPAPQLCKFAHLTEVM
jgi:hypothetical protein